MECYICYDKETSSDKFVKEPCRCKGSNKIHKSCLKKLIEKNGSMCSICKKTFSLNTTKSHSSYDSFDSYKVSKSKNIIENVPIQSYIFREDNQNYYFEDENNIINYTYVGNGTYRVDYKHKKCCVIS